MFQGPVGVAYSQFYLGDGTEDLIPDYGCVLTGGVGLVGVEPGGAICCTALHSGIVGVTVVVAETDPGPDLDGYEDIVEIDFQALSASIAIEEWEADNVTELGELPAGPGNYRLRYHAVGMDEAPVTYSPDLITARYLIQLWPTEPSGPTVVRKVSARSRRF